MVLILLLLPSNHDNLILRLHRKKTATFVNKEVLAPNLYINLHN